MWDNVVKRIVTDMCYMVFSKFCLQENAGEMPAALQLGHGLLLDGAETHTVTRGQWAQFHLPAQYSNWSLESEKESEALSPAKPWSLHDFIGA